MLRVSRDMTLVSATTVTVCDDGYRVHRGLGPRLAFDLPEDEPLVHRQRSSRSSNARLHQMVWLAPYPIESRIGSSSLRARLRPVALGNSRPGLAACSSRYAEVRNTRQSKSRLKHGIVTVRTRDLLPTP